MDGKYIITLQLPDGTNYWCGQQLYRGLRVEIWDTDIEYAISMSFNDSEKQYTRLKNLKGSEHCIRKIFDGLKTKP